MNENAIGTRVIEAAIAVHRDHRPGVLETVHEITLFKEMSRAGLSVERQVPVPIPYKGVAFEEGFRADMISLKRRFCWN